MKTVRIYQTGGPEVLNYEDAPEPSPAPGQAVVEIKSIGVNYTDVSSRKGTNPARRLSLDAGARGRWRGHRRRRRRDRGGRGRPRGLCYAHWHLLAVPLRPRRGCWSRSPTAWISQTAAATMLQGMTAHFLVYGIAHLGAGRPRAGPRRRWRHGTLAHPDAQERRRVCPHHRVH